MKINKLNEKMNFALEEEWNDIMMEVISPAIQSIGGDVDNITGGAYTDHLELTDHMVWSFYSTVNKKDARKFKKNFITTIKSALAGTRFSDLQEDEDRTYAYALSKYDISDSMGSDRAEEFLSNFVMFEILITSHVEAMNEAMTIAYDQKTIDNQIKVIEKNLEDYKKLVIEEPDDKEYWQEQIKKCQDEINDLKSHKSLDEAKKEEILYIIQDSHGNQLSAPNSDDDELWDRVSSMEARGRRGLCVVVYTGKKVNEAWDDTETIYGAYDAYIEDCAWKQEDPISFEKFRDNYLGNKEESEEEFNSRIKYWAVLATDRDTGKEYYAGVYESERWAYYWAGMDRSADAEYGYGNFDYRVEQVSEYTEEMDNSKSELTNLKLKNYDNRNMTESVKRLGAGKKLNESSRGFYVTTYWPDEKWSPEEGGSMSYGWDANRSKFFRTEQEAQEYVDYILGGCEIISNYEGEYEYRDEDGDLMKIAIEPFHKRGKGHSPARTWSEIEFDDPVERPYFDRKGNRLARNPRLVAKEKKDAIELEKEFFAGIDSATTRKELIDFISDIKYSKLFVNNGEIIGNKWKSLKEASYGGAYDIADNQYFTREDLENFADEVIECIAAREDALFDVSELYIDGDVITLGLNNEKRNGEFEHSETFKVDMRKIRQPRDLDKYVQPIADKFIKEYKSQCGELTEDAQYDVKVMELEKVPSILNWDIADQLQDCFRENKLWVDELHYNQVRDRIEFDINWGDWKHEHLRARWLLQELFEKLGIQAEIDSHTTEEDGSDTYSAHYNVYATGKR